MKKTKLLIVKITVIVAVACAVLFACTAGKFICFNNYEEFGDPIMVQIEMENGGIIKLELYPEAAPITVENFLSLQEVRSMFSELFFEPVDVLVSVNDSEWKTFIVFIVIHHKLSEE